MSEEKPEETAEEKKEGEESPEEQAANKLSQMRGEIEQFQQEVKILEGMLKNRKPEVVGSIKKENDVLEKKKNELEVVFYAAVKQVLQSNTTAEHQRSKKTSSQCWAPREENFKSTMHANWMKDSPVMENDFDIATNSHSKGESTRG